MGRSATAKAFLYVFFAGLLATPLLLRHLSASADEVPVGADADAILARYGFYLEEVSALTGIDFRHEAPTFDAQLEHIMQHIASTGAAVSVVDFNRNGLPDLYVTNSAEGSFNRLYQNMGDGTFKDVAVEMGVADANHHGTGVSQGAVWGDYNNSGYEDLFLYKYGRPELFRNDAGTGFTRVTEEAGLPGWINTNSAIWLDFDNDGYLDLFIAGYFAEDIDFWNLGHTRILPESFEYARNGGRNYLLRNRGDGTFEDVTDAMGVNSTRWALAAGAADLTGNGYPDIFVSNDYGFSELYLNDEGRHFREVGIEARVGHPPKSGMNVAFGDVFNDGRLTIYETNISEEGVLIQGNNLFVPRERSDGSIRYDNMARALGVELGGWSYGAQFGDLNNDGYLDLYLVNGFISGERGSSYWYDFSKIAGGTGRIISDARNWPPLDGRSLSGHQPSRVWLNDGAGRFREVSQIVGADDVFDGRSVVLVDLWNRGVLDVVVANQRGPLLIYRNNVDPERQWIGFELEGTRSNRSAISAAVEVHWNGRMQVQHVTGGIGFSGQNQRRLHFGLGVSPDVEKAVIRWPSGHTQTIERPEPGQYHRIVEPAPL